MESAPNVRILRLCLQQRSSKVTWNYTWNLTLRRWIPRRNWKQWVYYGHYERALSTPVPFQKYAFSLSSKTHQNVHTKTFQKDRIARCDVSWTLWYFRSSFSSWCVFDRPHHCDMYVFSFRSIFKNVFKSTRFPWKRSACGQNAWTHRNIWVVIWKHIRVDGTKGPTFSSYPWRLNKIACTLKTSIKYGFTSEEYRSTPEWFRVN